MKAKLMSMSRFRDLTAAYGANLSRWPEAELPSARALLRESKEAAAVLAGEASFDALLETLPREPLPDSLRGRLLRLPAEQHTPRPLRLPRRAMWGPAFGWAAAAAVGVWLGTSTAPESAEAASAPEAEAAASEATQQAGLIVEDEIIAIARGTMLDLEELP